MEPAAAVAHALMLNENELLLATLAGGDMASDIDIEAALPESPFSLLLPLTLPCLGLRVSVAAEFESCLCCASTNALSLAFSARRAFNSFSLSSFLDRI